MKMKEICLFAGVGGGALGGKLLGWETSAYVEWDLQCRKVLRARMADGTLHKAPIYNDVREFNGKEWKGNIDIITGGFPCQPFSFAGKQKGENDERNMWPATIKVLSETNADFALFENVRGLLAFPYFGKILSDINAAGYSASWMVINASDVGAMHMRPRLWIICLKNNKRRLERILEYGWGKLCETVMASSIVIADVSDKTKIRFPNAFFGIRCPEWPINGIMIDGLCFDLGINTFNNTSKYQTPTSSGMDYSFSLKSTLSHKFGVKGITDKAVMSQTHILLIEKMKKILINCLKKEGVVNDDDIKKIMSMSLSELRKAIKKRKEKIFSQENSILWKKIDINTEWLEWLMGWPIRHTSLEKNISVSLPTSSLFPWANGEFDIIRTIPIKPWVGAKNKDPFIIDQLRRIKQTGNGQVPLCVYVAWKVIEEWGNNIPDVISKSTKSMIMSVIKGKGILPERMLSAAFSAIGIEHKMNVSDVTGQPNIIVKINEKMVAIFIDGCFWHGCQDHYKKPKSNIKFWENKIAKNIKRDREVDEILSANGIIVKRVWEHDIKTKKMADAIVKKILVDIITEIKKK